MGLFIQKIEETRATTSEAPDDWDPLVVMMRLTTMTEWIPDVRLDGHLYGPMPKSAM